ncbi:MAG: molybdenum cofactor guanylyltransferase [Candidatus Aminicenantes bacterium]|nr:molybdenum cofactor guanylyltransferase [Candidatus Aminicenantes bacterium]
MNTDKKHLKINDSSLFDRVLSQTEKLFKNIVISSSNNEEIQSGRFRVVNDIYSNRGPLSGILSGLIGSANEKNFIIAADIPELSTELISEMYNFTDEFEIVIPESGINKIEPLFGFYNKSTIPVIRKNLSMGKNKILDIFENTTIKIVRMKNTDWYFNLNTEEDYRKYLLYLNNRDKPEATKS